MKKTIIMLIFLPFLCFGQDAAYTKNDSNLLIWYKFDGNLTETKSGSNGVVTGTSPSSSVGVRDTSYILTVDNSWVDDVNANIFNGFTEGTIVGWVRPTASGRQYAGVFSTRKNDASNLTGFNSGAGDGNVRALYMSGNSALQPTFPFNEWILCAVTKKGSVHREYYFRYIDRSITTWIYQSAAATTVQERAFRMWQDYGFVVRSHWGNIDNIMVFNRCLNSNELEQLFFGTWKQCIGKVSDIKLSQGIGIGD